jgi:hypothetical protein
LSLSRRATFGIPTTRREKEFGDGDNGGYREDDWKFYKNLRDTRPSNNPKRLAMHSDAVGQFWNRGEEANSGGDGLQILAPTEQLVIDGNACDDFNDCSTLLPAPFTKAEPDAGSSTLGCPTSEQVGSSGIAIQRGKLLHLPHPWGRSWVGTALGWIELSWDVA